MAKLQDPFLFRDYASEGGAILAGDIPPCQRWPPRDRPEVFNAQEFAVAITVLQAEQSALRAAGAHRLPGPRDQQKAWDLLMEETAAGAWTGPWSEAERQTAHGPFLSWLYFVVKQEKWEAGPVVEGRQTWTIKVKERGCLDPADLNKAPLTVLPDKCYMAGAAGVLSLLDACVQSSPGEAWNYFSDDVFNGFRIVKLRPSQKSLFGATAKDPKTGEVKYFFQKRYPSGREGVLTCSLGLVRPWPGSSLCCWPCQRPFTWMIPRLSRYRPVVRALRNPPGISTSTSGYH